MTFSKAAWMLACFSLPAFSTAAAADDSTNAVDQSSSPAQTSGQSVNPSGTLAPAQELVVPDSSRADSQEATSNSQISPLDAASYAMKLRSVLQDSQRSSDAKIAEIKDLEKKDPELIVGPRVRPEGFEPAIWVVVARAIRGEDPGLKLLRFFLRNGADVNEGKDGRTVLRLAAFPQPYAQDQESEEGASAPPSRIEIAKLLIEYGAFPGIADPQSDPHLFMASEDTAAAREIQRMIDDALAEGPDQAFSRRNIKLQTLLEEAQDNGDSLQAANLQRALARTEESKTKFMNPIDLTQYPAVQAALAEYLKNRVKGNSKSATINHLVLQRRIGNDGRLEDWVVGTVSLKTLQLEKIIPKIGPVGGREDVMAGDRQEWPVSFEFNLETGEGCQTLSHTAGHGLKARNISVSTWEIRNLILPHSAEFQSKGW